MIKVKNIEFKSFSELQRLLTNGRYQQTQILSKYGSLEAWCCKVLKCDDSELESRLQDIKNTTTAIRQSNAVAIYLELSGMRDSARAAYALRACGLSEDKRMIDTLLVELDQLRISLMH